MNKLLSLFTLLFWCGGLQAQVDLNQGAVVQPTFHDTIPFEYIRGKMLVELEIGGKLRKFILDTGAPCAVFDYLQREMDAPITHKDSMRDIAGGIMELDRTELPFFKLGQLEFSNIPALVMREQTGSLLKCWGVDGIIGSNALRHCILQIDLKARHLILSNQLHQLDLSNHSTVPLHLSEQESDPYLELTLSEDHVILANFDTGDEEVFSVSEEDAALLLERQRAHLSNTGHGKMIISVTESQQDQWFKLVNFDTLTIDATHFMNFNSELWEEQLVSRVGIGLGEYGIITVDYLNQQFHFQDYGKKAMGSSRAIPDRSGFLHLSYRRRLCYWHRLERFSGSKAWVKKRL